MSSPNLPATADFVEGGRNAYWMMGTDLFRSSGPRVLNDVRTDLGGTAGDQAWTTGLLQLVGDRARSRGAGASVPPMLITGQPLSRQWLRLALWVVYQGSGYAQSLDHLRMPGLLRVPNIGQVIPAMDDLGTVVTPGFNPALLASNPFENRGAGFNISGNLSNNDKMMLFAAGALILLSGDGK